MANGNIDPAISCLFPELLATIFLHCMPELDDYCPIVPSAPPLVFGQVCRTWRTVALSEPILWSSIEVWLSGSSEGMPYLVETWLSRSGSRPLHIAVVFEDSTDESVPWLPTQIERRTFERILGVALRYSSRWQTANLYLPLVVLVQFRNDETYTFPLLEYLSLSPDAGFETVMSRTSDDDIMLFQNAPNLRHVRLGRGYGKGGQFILPWPQITTLDLFLPLTTYDCLHLLAQCRQLEQCHICVTVLRRRTDNLPIVQLPYLQDLIIFTCLDLSSFYKQLTLPALRLLQVTHDHETDGIRWPGKQLRYLAQRSSLNLLGLTLKDVHLEPRHFIDCLDTFASLRVLGIESSHACRPIADDVLHRLTYDSTDRSRAILVPRLRALSLTGDLSFDEELLANMVQSRWSIPEEQEEIGRLENLRICLVDEIDPEVTRRFEQFQEEGLTLSLSYIDKEIIA